MDINDIIKVVEPLVVMDKAKINIHSKYNKVINTFLWKNLPS